VFVLAAQNPHVDGVITETSTPSVGDKLDGGGGHPTVPPTLPLRDHVTNYDHYLYTVSVHRLSGHVLLEERELKRYREPKDTVIIHVDTSLSDIKLTTPSSNHRWRLTRSHGMVRSGRVWYVTATYW